MEHKQRICFLQYNLQGGGAERKVCTLANYFAAQGHQVEIGLFGVNTVAYQLDQRVHVTFLRRENYEYKNKNAGVTISVGISSGDNLMSAEKNARRA